jgi:hypothetical protein
MRRIGQWALALLRYTQFDSPRDGPLETNDELIYPRVSRHNSRIDHELRAGVQQEIQESRRYPKSQNKTENIDPVMPKLLSAALNANMSHPI